MLGLIVPPPTALEATKRTKPTPDSHDTLPRRHRPRHHQQRAGVPRPARLSPRAKAAGDSAVRGAAARRGGRGRRSRSAAVVPVSAGAARFAGRGDRAAVGPPARLRGRRVCPQPRGARAGAARDLGQVVAVPCGSRSLGAAVAVGGAAGCPAHLAGRSVDALFAAARRCVELPDGGGQTGLSPGEAAGRADGARLVRRYGPHADRRGGTQGGIGERHAAGGAAGRILLLARDAQRGGGGTAAAGRSLPRGRCRRRHHRLQPDPGRRARRGADVHSRGSRRSPAARR